MHIKSFSDTKDQMAKLGDNHWSVSRLIELSKNFKVMNVPLDHLNVFNTYEKLTLREMVMHMNAINDADLKYPIILDEDGDIMDGRHRIMKAMLIKAKTIKAVRFDENPSPCRIDD